MNYQLGLSQKQQKYSHQYCKSCCSHYYYRYYQYDTYYWHRHLCSHQLRETIRFERSHRKL